MIILVKAAFKKIGNKERYNSRYDLCNHFNMVEFNTKKIPQLNIMINTQPEETQKIIETVFEEFSNEWAFSESDQEEFEDVFLTNKTIESIVNLCKVRCQEFLMTIPKEEIDPTIRRTVKELPQQVFGDIITKTLKRKDGKEVRISDKYFKRYACPPNYRYDDIQNDKITGEFKKSQQNSYQTIFQDKGTGRKICSAVMVQPKQRGDKDYKADQYYCVQHYRRGFELVSERGTFDDMTFMDIARRTIIKELNVDALDKVEITGKVVENGDSKIFLFTIVNFDRIEPMIPLSIQDKNIIGSKWAKYSELKPWSKFHIKLYEDMMSPKI